jgi:TetR/AcrR family transcriptional regulator
MTIFRFMDDSKIATILEAARKRFAHYGLGKTTMNDIATDIGMSKASLYYYFTDKETIFAAVVERDMAEFVNAIEQIIDRPSKASFKLKKHVSLRNRLLIQLFNLGRIENPNPTDLFNPIFDQLKITYFAKEKALVQRILQYGIDEKEFSKIPVEAYADIFVSGLSGLRTNALTSPDVKRRDQEKVSEQSALFTEIFLRSIQI